jgi:phosphoglycolate phosphatase
MTRTALVLFDLDGTLVDSAPDIAHAANLALREVGAATRSEAEIRTYVGNGAEKLIHRCLTGDRDGEAPDALHAATYRAFQTHYARCLSDRTRVFPGVLETLAQLEEAGILLGCVTNKPARFTLPLLEALNLARHFRVTVSGDTLPRKKPDPGPLLEAAHRCGVEVTDCVMVGDSLADLGAARAAGMRIFCVAYGYPAGADLSAHAPDALVSDMREFLPLLLPAN